MKFAVRKWLSALIDFIIDIAVMGLFYTGARGYVADGDVGKGNIMLICALLAIVFLTCYVPYKQGQTVGQAIFKVKVINKDADFIKRMYHEVSLWPALSCFFSRLFPYQQCYHVKGLQYSFTT